MCYKVRSINARNLNQQLALPLTFKVVKNRENFLVSKCNELAVKLIENSESWQSRKKINAIPAVLIYGPKACGKTHLSYIFRQYNDCIYLSSLSNNDLELIEKGKIFILDDFAPGLKYPAELMMHFLNQVTYNEGSVLFLSRYSAFDMDWSLDDLNSRIRSLMSCQIKLPDDVLLYSFMVKYAGDKKLVLNDKQIIYILERLDRNFQSIIGFIDKLDNFSLETKKKVSYNSIKNILNNLKNN